MLAFLHGVCTKVHRGASRRVPRAVGQMAIISWLSACVPMHHSIAPYDRDLVAARALEEHAADVCAAVRGRDALPPYPFTTDGCSFWPDKVWERCCIEHDIDYWCGGSGVERCASDRRLRACVEAAGHGTVGQVMQFGARLGGHPWLPFPWRWGYGWDWPYSYDESAERRLLRGSDEGCAEHASPSSPASITP